MDRNVTTTKASLVLGLHSQRIERDILLDRLPCERANNKAFILNR